MVIYLKHAVHGTKVAICDAEVEEDAVEESEEEIEESDFDEDEDE